MFKINIAIFFVLSALISGSILGQTNLGVIEGKIRDHDTKQEIPGAVIEVIGVKAGAASDAEGNFKISGLASGNYNLKISAPFYSTLARTDVSVSSIQSTKMSIELKVSTFETDEVIIKSGKLFEKAPDFSISTNTLTPEEIRRSPGAAEDVSRMAQSLPGVTVATDSRNDLIVRGGSPIENFILIDGIEIPNINHFGTQGASGGPIGMINADFLNDVIFNAGGFPAKYGDRLSSILDINYRDGDKNRFTGKFDLGLAGAGVILEGPVQSGKSSFLFSARKSYLDFIATGIGLTAVPNYTNFNFKATYDFSASHKLELLGLAGIDKIEFKEFDNKESPFIENTKYDGWQSIVGVAHKWLVSKQTYIQTSFSNSNYRKTINMDSVGRPTFKIVSTDLEYVLRTDVLHRFTPSDLFEVGFNLKYLVNTNEIFRARTLDIYGNFLPDFNYDKSENGIKFGSYIQYTKTFLNKVNVNLGLRQDYFNYINEKNSIAPRASVSYSPVNNFKINAAYGIYYQAPPMIWLVSDLRNKDLRQIKSEQYVLGFEYYPAEDIKIQLEIFNKKYSDYPSSFTNKQVSYANLSADYNPGGLEYIVSGSEGFARGIEFFVQKKLTDNLYGMLNYSYSMIKFTALDKIERSSSFDYKNVFTLILGYKFSNAFEVSAKWRYMGGRPVTPLDIAASTKQNQAIYDYSRFLADKLPDYHRLDLRMDYRIEFKGWSLVTFIDFENVYNQQNVESLIWDQKKNQPAKVYQWSFIPAGGVKIEF